MSVAQTNSTTYLPFRNDSLLAANLLKKTAQRFESDKSAISGENKKYTIKEYQQRFEHIKEMYEKNRFITDYTAKNYLDALLELIVKNNPFLRSLNPTVLFSKLYWPNAASFGEGTIMFNISLFSRLQNESQAAFVLCHELSHYYLDHSNKAINQYVNTLYSKEFQEQLKEIKKSEYQQGRNLDKLVKNISYKSKRHSRDHEIQADSMALELLKSAGFDVRESLSCLALLDSVDKEKYAGALHLQEQFNFAAYPFQTKWLRKSSLSLSEAMSAYDAKEETDKDSLKTHPDCNVRIKQLEQKVETCYNSSQKLFLVNSSLFNELVKKFDYELVEYCYQSDEIGRALYYALQLFYHNKENAYLATMIGKCLNRIYYAQREHTLGKITDLNTGINEKEYEQYLQFLRNLRLADIASISYYFMKQQDALFNTDKDFEEVYKDCKTIFASINN